MRGRAPYPRSSNSLERHLAYTQFPNSNDDRGRNISLSPLGKRNGFFAAPTRKSDGDDDDGPGTAERRGRLVGKRRG